MWYLSLATIAVIALVVLVGYLIWALKIFCQTLQRIDEMVVNTERELTPLLASLRESSERMRLAADNLQQGVHRAGGFFEAIGEVGDSIHSVNAFLNSGTRKYLSQGMALWTGFQAFRHYFKRSHEAKGE